MASAKMTEPTANISAPIMPDSVHIVVVVYGKTYAKLLADITLPNLAAMVREIPEPLRARSLLRILTTADDIPVIEASVAIPAIREAVRIEILDALKMAGFERHGGYGPMVVTQREAVYDAARANAAIFFVGPDQIYSRGSFANFINRLRQGYRIVVGPGVRIMRDAARPLLCEKIATSDQGSLSLSADEQIGLLFRHWHPINDQFVIGSPQGIPWKAYVYHRPHRDELLIRFFQGPTLMAWPREIDGFDGFIDHDLVQYCCRSWREAYVVTDARECLALDMTDDARRDDIENLAIFPPVDLLCELFDHKAIKTAQIFYGLRTCRVHRGEHDPADVARWNRELARAIDPLILLALVERSISRRLGRAMAGLYRFFVLLNANTLALMFRTIASNIVDRWRQTMP
jgi:hypothetical protein